MTPRRIIIVAIVAAVVLFLVFAIYVFVRSRGGAGGETDGTLPDAGDQIIPAQDIDEAAEAAPPAEASKRADNVLAYAVNDDGTIAVVQTDGKILRVDGDSSATLNNVALSNVVRASFSADGTKALVLFGTPGAVKASVFDLPTASWLALAGTYEDAAWAPQGYTIATLSASVQGSVVALVTPTVRPTPQTIATLRAQSLRLEWQTPSSLIIYDRPSAIAQGTAWSLNTQSRVITPLVRATYGMDLAWNTVRNIGIVFRGSPGGRGGSLALAGGTGVRTAQFNFLTLPSKCSFVGVGTSTTAVVSDYLACGVPIDQSRFASAQLPDRYDQKGLFTLDRLVVVDLDSQGIVFVGTPDVAADVQTVRLAGNTLYFINRYDNGLYATPFQ